MKKLILLLLASTGIASAAHAQGARLGLKAGASLTSFVGKDAFDDFTYKFGAHGGLVAEIGITDNFAIQPEVLFSMKGTQDDNDSDNRINQNYIDVPVLFKVKADGLFFELGPQIGFLISSEDKTNRDSYDSKDDYKPVDFGYVAGLGYEFSSGPMIGLRYNGGLSKIPDLDFGRDVKVSNSAFQLYVGYMFGGK